MFRRSHFFRRSASASSPFLQLQDIPTNRSWDFSKPTLTKRGRFVQREDWATHNDEFLSHMRGLFPSLPQILDSAPGLYLKGGFCASVLLGKKPTDLDLYITDCEGGVDESQMRCAEILKTIVGLTVERSRAEEDARIESHQRHAKSGRGSSSTVLTTEEVERRRNSAKQRALGNLCAIRRGAVVTVTGIPGCDVPLQICLVPYKDRDALINESDVDCGACSFSFDEGQGGLLLSERAANSIQNWTLRATGMGSTAGNALAPFRLRSYFERGFDIILPNFDPSKVSIQHPLSGVQTSFELCDGQLLVEVEPEDMFAASRGPRSRSSAMTPLTNRIAVARMKEKVQRGNLSATDRDSPNDALLSSTEVDTAGGSTLESFPALASGMISASATPELAVSAATPGSQLFKKNAKYVRSLSTNAIHHNVRELLQHGKNFHVVSTGGNIINLSDLRSVPVTQRNLDTTLHSMKEKILADPFSTASLQHLLQFFPVQHPVDTFKELLPPSSVFKALAEGEDLSVSSEEGGGSADASTAATASSPSSLMSFEDRVKQSLEGVHKKQMDEAIMLLEKIRTQLAAEELTNLLPTPVSYELSEPAYYGACYSK